MKRITEKNFNTPEEYKKIYQERGEKKVNWFDDARWKFLLRYFKGGKLVDLGCLDSLLPLYAKRKYPKAEIWGLDFVPEVIEKQQKEYPEIQWVCANVYETHFPNNYFDYAVAGELVEHLEDIPQFFHETFRILKNNGICALSTPLGETQKGEVDNYHHLWSFSKDDFSQMLSKYGTIKMKVIGSQYFPKYKYHFPYLLVFCKKNA